METLFTIITICYNAEKTIERTIRSVLAQEGASLEYIIIDGGSTDKTLEIVNKYTANIDIVVSEPDDGISDAFNKGIKLATGKWVTLLNADDWFEKDALSIVASSGILDEVSVVCSNMNFWQNDQLAFVSKSRIDGIRKNMTINHMGSFVKRNIYLTKGFYRTDYRLAMDYEYFLRLNLAGVKFGYLNSVLVNMSADGVSDLNILKSYSEVKNAQILHNLNFVTVYSIYTFKIIKHKVKLFLKYLGLQKIVMLYQQLFTIRGQK